MRLLHLMAVRAFRERGLRQMIVCPASAGAALGMASFWIRHRTTPLFSVPAPPFRIFRPGGTTRFSLTHRFGRAGSRSEDLSSK